MNPQTSSNISTTSGTTLLLLVFVTLKLCGVITWSWWWVLSPLWIPCLLVVVALGIYFLAVARKPKESTYERQLREILDHRAQKEAQQ